MFHLFNSVYVETDRAMLERSNHINFSVDTGYEFIYTEYDRRFGEQLGFAKNIDDLTPEEFEALMKKAFNYEDKLYIYCDSPSYNRMYSILIKALFPTIDLETYKYLFLCLKSGYEIKRLRHAVKDLSISEGVIIDLATTQALYEMEDPLVKPFQRVVMAREKHLSMEWRVIRLITSGKVSNIPSVLNNLIDRMVIGYAKMALEEWSNMVTSPSVWAFAGTDLDLLLAAETTSSGCPLLAELGHPIFNTDFAFKADVDDEWRMSVLNKCIEIYEQMERNTHIVRMRTLQKFVEPTYTIDSAEKCMDFIRATFIQDRYQVQLAHNDVTKYNASIIRWVLASDPEALKRLIVGAVW